MEFANIQLFSDHGILEAKPRLIINNPLIYSQHWPKPNNNALIEED